MAMARGPIIDHPWNSNPPIARALGSATFALHLCRHACSKIEPSIGTAHNSIYPAPPSQASRSINILCLVSSTVALLALLPHHLLRRVRRRLDHVLLRGRRVGGREVRVPAQRDDIDQEQAEVRGHDREVGQLDRDCVRWRRRWWSGAVRGQLGSGERQGSSGRAY